MFIQWIPELKPDHIRLSPKWFVLRTIPSSLWLHFGAWKKEFILKINDHLPQSIVELPKAMMNHFTIPADLPYEIYLEGNHLHIGPVIALLLAKRNHLTPEYLEKHRGYLINYRMIKGLIYICSLNGINPKNQTVEGFYFDPNAKGKEQWKKGIFPYPGAVFRRIRVYKNAHYDHLITHIERKIFNPHFLDKSKLWDSLSPDPILVKYLPHTKPLNHLQDLNEMLDLYGQVYLKPANSYMGKGISTVKKMRNGYLFTNRHKEKTMIRSSRQASSFLRYLKRGRKYLIQQSVALTFNNRNVDFRVILQKDESQHWDCSGIIARFGRSGRFYTNDVSSIGLGKDALRTIFHLDEDAAAEKEKEIISICTAVCRRLDTIYGPSGDMGIDVAVDQNLRVWILEINSLQHHKMAAYLIDDPHMYARVMSRPLEYAKALAGFRGNA